MNQGSLDEAKRTFLTCAHIPDENLKDPHAHKSSVTSCLYNLGKLLHEQGRHEVSATLRFPLLKGPLCGNFLREFCLTSICKYFEFEFLSADYD